MKYSSEDLNAIYEDETRRVTALCEFETELVGGMPADAKAIRAFAEHHLGLAGQDLEDAVKRIQKDEIGERERTPEQGEVREEEVYGLNVIRRDEHGPWLGNWMVKACLKASASRLGLFKAKGKIGAKGDMAEFGRVTAQGASLNGVPHRIHLIGPDGVTTTYQKFMGRVHTPQGDKSIVHDSEVAPVGTRFAFEFRLPKDRLKPEDIARVCAYAGQVGLGSAKALERGKYRFIALEIQD